MRRRLQRDALSPPMAQSRCSGLKLTGEHPKAASAVCKNPMFTRETQRSGNQGQKQTSDATLDSICSTQEGTPLAGPKLSPINVHVHSSWPRNDTEVAE